MATISLAVPAVASAADLSSSDRSSVNATVNSYFSAAAAGDLKELNMVTTPTFVMNSIEGQSLDAASLAGKWRVIRLEYGGIHGSVRLSKMSFDGTTVTVDGAVHAYGDTLVHGEPNTSSLNAVHHMRLIKADGGWKVASDRVASQNIQQ